MACVPFELLADVKVYCGITWDDPATDRKIEILTGAGMAYLDGKHGGEADYLNDGMPRTLLFEYVRYARDSALDVFEINYRSMLLSMQSDKAVMDFVACTEQT